MAQLAACPDAARLQQLLHGLLTDQEAAPLEEHLEHCPVCLHALRRLPADDLLHNAAGRASGVTDICPSWESANEDLIRRLKALRPPDGTADTFVASPTPNPDRRPGPTSPGTYQFLAPPQQRGEVGRLGPYRVLEVLGSGGMGVVYRAEDVQLKRQVALKVMRPEAAGKPAARERFLREAQAAAALEHEHIVTIYQVGAEGGVPFLAMQWLKGMSLEERLKRSGPLSVPQVLRLGRQTALGLAAAHARGLVHRDIKPANLWLEPEHGGRIRILDFGLARALGDDVQLTRSGELVGTPAYMAPEQARGEKVDHRCDLFSLGVVLYRMLTGRLPFRGDNTLAVLSALATDTPPPPRQVNPAVPAPLSDLVVQLLAKDPAQRPRSAREVAERLQALERHMAAPPAPPAPSRSEAVHPVAVPVGPHPQAIPVRRAVRRRVLIVAAALLLAVGGGLLAEVIIRIRDKDGKVTEVRAPAGTQEVEIEKDGKKITVPIPGDKPKAQSVSIKPEPLPPIKGGEPLSPDALVQRPASIKGVRSWSIETVKPRGWAVLVAYSPDGKRLAAAGADCTIRVYDAASYRLVNVLLSRPLSQFNGACPPNLAWLPDSETLVDALSGTEVRLWDVGTGRLIRRLILEESMYGFRLACSPKGKQVAVTRPGELQVWDLATGKLARRAQQASGTLGPRCLSWSPDGRTIAIGYDESGSVPLNGSILLYDATSLELRRTLEDFKGTAIVYALGWAPDSKSLFAALWDKWVACWNPETGQCRWVADVSSYSVACSPDGKTVAAGYGEVVFLNSASGEVVRRANYGRCGSLSWSAEGKRLAVAYTTGQPFDVFEAVSGDLVKRVEIEPWYLYASPVRWSPGGNALAVNDNCSEGGSETVSVWDCATGKLGHCIHGYGAIAWSPDGERLAINGFVYDGRTGKVVRQLGTGAGVLDSAWSPDGGMVALLISQSHTTNGVQVWAPVTGKLLHSLDDTKAAQLAWSPDGKRLAARSAPALRIWDSTAGKQVQVLEKPPADPQTDRQPFAWSPDGKLLAMGHLTDVRIWDSATGDLLETLHGNTKTVEGLLWSADGKTLTSDAADGMRDWDVATGQLLRHRKWRLGAPSADRRFGADGSVNTVRVWDLETGQRRLTLMLLADERWVAFSPDGHYRGSPRVERDLVYLVQTEDGTQRLLTPDEFAQQYGWKNDPERVGLPGK